MVGCHPTDHLDILMNGRWVGHLSKLNSGAMTLPQEDMCQALGVGPGLKYQADGGPGITDIMQVLLGAENADADRERFIQSQVLFWLLAAIDGHAKNFSLTAACSSKMKSYGTSS